MTEALFLETVHTEETLRERQKSWLNVSGVLNPWRFKKLIYSMEKAAPVRPDCKEIEYEREDSRLI